MQKKPEPDKRVIPLTAPRSAWKYYKPLQPDPDPTLNPALAHKPKSESRISHSDFFLAFERVKARLKAKAVSKNDRNAIDLFDATMISVTAFCDLMAIDLWEKGKPKIEVAKD